MAALLVERSGEMDLAFRAIETDHFAEAIAEPVPMRLREVVHLVFAWIEAARRHAVQQWFPEVGPAAFDQSDRRARAPAEAIAQAGHELQATCPTADHDDAVERRVAGGVVRV